MKIALIGHGALPIPPRDWGAVEGTIWQRKLHLERLGHVVDIANTRAIHEVIYLFNQVGYDFVHCHSELFLLECLAHLRCPFAVTSHNSLLHRFRPDATRQNRGFQFLFEDTLLAPANIVLSDRIRDMYQSAGYRKPVYVLRNAAEVESFKTVERGNGRAVCVGMISGRKRQAWLAETARNRVTVDFVGPETSEPQGRIVENETAKYLGVWDRETLYERLGHYNCLVLLSRSEGAPKVIPEALAAGLSVVISEACTANLTDEPFITVLPDNETNADVIAQAIQSAIDRNHGQRDLIRRYAKERFDYSVIIPEYLRIIDDIRAHYAGLGPGPWRESLGAVRMREAAPIHESIALE